MKTSILGLCPLVSWDSVWAILVALRVPIGILPAHWCLRRWVIWCVPGAVDGNRGAALNFLIYLLCNIAFSRLVRAVS